MSTRHSMEIPRFGRGTIQLGISYRRKILEKLLNGTKFVRFSSDLVYKGRKFKHYDKILDIYR